jgi:hypothetical protein
VFFPAPPGTDPCASAQQRSRGHPSRAPRFPIPIPRQPADRSFHKIAPFGTVLFGDDPLSFCLALVGKLPLGNQFVHARGLAAVVSRFLSWASTWLSFEPLERFNHAGRIDDNSLFVDHRAMEHGVVAAGVDRVCFVEAGGVNMVPEIDRMKDGVKDDLSSIAGDTQGLKAS